MTNTKKSLIGLGTVGSVATPTSISSVALVKSLEAEEKLESDKVTKDLIESGIANAHETGLSAAEATGKKFAEVLMKEMKDEAEELHREIGARIKTLEDQQVGLSSRVEDNKKSVSELADDVDSNKKQIAQNQKDIDSKFKDLTEVTDKNKKELSDRITSEVKDLNQRLETVDGKLKSHEKKTEDKFEQLESSIDEVKNDHKHALQLVDKNQESLRKDLKSAEDKIDSNKKQLSALKDKVDTNEMDIDFNQRRIDQNQGVIRDIEGKFKEYITKHEDEFQKLGTDLTQRLGVAEEKIESNQGVLDTIKKNLESAEKSFKDKLNTFGIDIESIKNKVDYNWNEFKSGVTESSNTHADLEDSVSTIKSKFDSMKTWFTDKFNEGSESADERLAAVNESIKDNEHSLFHIEERVSENEKAHDARDGDSRAFGSQLYDLGCELGGIRKSLENTNITILRPQLVKR